MVEQAEKMQLHCQNKIRLLPSLQRENAPIVSTISDLFPSCFTDPELLLPSMPYFFPFIRAFSSLFFPFFFFACFYFPSLFFLRDCFSLVFLLIHVFFLFIFPFLLFLHLLLFLRPFLMAFFRTKKFHSDADNGSTVC